jgi:CO/xanthine dehydrogenase FAD-binding subunit
LVIYDAAAIQGQGKERTDVVTFYRRLPKFDVVRPRSMEEALGLLKGNHDGEIRAYAGGTDLIPKLKRRLIKTPKCLMDLKSIPGLDYVQKTGDGGLKIGTLASISSVVGSPLVRRNYPILAQAAGSIAATQIQNRGTVVGNICNAVPSADSAPALLCLDAQVLCMSSGKERSIGMDEFFLGPNQTALKGDELVREMLLPAMPENVRGVYIKFSPRSRMDLAVVGVAVMVVLEKGALKDVRIGLGAVAPTPIKARKAEAILRGESVREELLAKAAKVASEEAKPISDHRASAEYRKMMVEVLVKRGLQQCLSS